ncbi:unnamed protein product [Arabidopsis halleri]
MHPLSHLLLYTPSRPRFNQFHIGTLLRKKVKKTREECLGKF